MKNLCQPIPLLYLAAFLAQMLVNGQEAPGLLWAVNLLTAGVANTESENIGDSGGGSAPPDPPPVGGDGS